jgi:hypothetical protein
VDIVDTGEELQIGRKASGKFSGKLVIRVVWRTQLRDLRGRSNKYKDVCGLPRVAVLDTAFDSYPLHRFGRQANRG